jgi:Flp pilus assembly protein TadG
LTKRDDVTDMRNRLIRIGRSAAGFEAAMTIPILLVLGVGVVEFGRAYQTWQVLMSAAREGARVAAVAGSTDAQIESAVRSYMTSERLEHAATTPVVLDRHVTIGPATGTRITIQYPYELTMLHPAVLLVRPDSTTSAPLTMSAVAIMRNES